MKKHLYLPLFILLALSLSNCQSASTPDLQATNEALTIQVNTQSAQITQLASAPVQPAQPTQPVTSAATATYLPAQPIPPTPTALPTSPQPGGIAPSLIFSGKGLITPWSNNTSYPVGLFAAANVHMICGDTPSGGSIYIDTKSYIVTCKANSDGWTPWKPALTIGDHYIYSANESDAYEFWTIGSPPFTIKNKNATDDFAFIINNPGEYQLSANVIKGAFNVYITCEKAQNFNYAINQSTTIQLVLDSANCELIIRDSPPGTVNPGEIEVSLAAK